MASLKFNGTDLEVLVNLAFVVSSHANGIEGASFSEWFPYFIQQLSCYSEKTGKVQLKLIIGFHVQRYENSLHEFQCF